jgi:hypothetical protein
VRNVATARNRWPTKEEERCRPRTIAIVRDPSRDRRLVALSLAIGLEPAHPPRICATLYRLVPGFFVVYPPW